MLKTLKQNVLQIFTNFLVGKAVVPVTQSKKGASPLEIVLYLLFILGIFAVIFILRDQLIAFVEAITNRVREFTATV